MLPDITLKDVSRDDVDRIAWWLEDRELSSKWFGHYGCGDPVHRGYDPQHMLEATESDWERVFADPHRLIFAIYDESGEHIGECQAVLDGEGGAELALMIGRKELWHHGYGTSTVITLMDRVFGAFDLDRVWVNIPEDSEPALGLFKKLGFKPDATRELCKRADGTALRVSILTMDTRLYRARWSMDSSRAVPMPVVTIDGLPGSGSATIGVDVAGMIGGRFVDEEISDRLCQRLRCTPGELMSLESGYRSFWARFLNSIAVPMEWSGGYDAGYYLFRTVPGPGLDYNVHDGQITKKQYLQGLAGVVRSLSAEGNVVLHGHGSHLFVPPDAAALKIFVSASSSVREQQIAADGGRSSDDAQRIVKGADGDAISIFKHLFRSDLLDMKHYDLTLNMDHMSFGTAAQIVVGALQVAAPLLTPRAENQDSLSVPIA